MTGSLAGRVALVTGGGRGIGLAIARALAADGASVSVAARSEQEVRSVAEEIGGMHVAVSLATETGCEHAVSETRRELGPIAILVNNAGVGSYDEEPIWAQTTETWRETMALNLDAPFWLTRLAAADMVERRWGRIVMISSTAGEVGAPAMSAYCASKHGLIGLMRSVAADTIPHGVTCNAVLPGWVRTTMADADAAAEGRDRGMTADEVWAERAERLRRETRARPERDRRRRRVPGLGRRLRRERRGDHRGARQSLVGLLERAEGRHRGAQLRVDLAVERIEAVVTVGGVRPAVKPCARPGHSRIEPDRPQPEHAGADARANVDDVELGRESVAGRLEPRRSRGSLRLQPATARARCSSLRMSLDDVASRQRDGVDEGASELRAEDVPVVTPTTAPRASGSHTGVRSPSRYGSARRPPGSGNELADIRRRRSAAARPGDRGAGRGRPAASMRAPPGSTTERRSPAAPGPSVVAVASTIVLPSRTRLCAARALEVDPRVVGADGDRDAGGDADLAGGLAGGAARPSRAAPAAAGIGSGGSRPGQQVVGAGDPVHGRARR